MECRRIWASWLVAAAGVVGFSLAPARPQVGWSDPVADAWSAGSRCAGETRYVGFFRHRPTPCQEAAARVPLDELHPAIRVNVKRVIDRPTLFTHGPSEAFTCCPAVYQWLLEHPDGAVAAWRRLGAQCTEIRQRPDGKFGWTDDQGSDLRWWTVHHTPAMRIWYAEGQVRATGIFPLIPVRAVVVLHHSEHQSQAGRSMVQHQAEMFLQTDNRAAALIARLLGAAAPQEAEKCASQMEMFFSALAWYVDQHPERGETLLKGILPADSAAWRELKRRTRSPKRSGSMPPSTLTSLRT
jgi:hypothetical protein